MIGFQDSRRVLNGVSAMALVIGLAAPAVAHGQAGSPAAQNNPLPPPNDAQAPTPAQTGQQGPAVQPTQSAVTPAGTSPTQSATTNTATEGAEAASDGATPGGQDVIVTGYRRSLEAALNVKRDSVSSVDAIIAEDVGKFPDQNLAESLQRLPGIALNREGGEGREITVRGLSGQFTTVRLNDLQAQAATYNAGSAGGTNSNRSFDFNQFASELFRSLVVHKTAEPSLDEGSLGAVVDLNTGHPLGGQTGLHLVVSGQGSYNDLSKTVGPKFSGLINWKSPSGKLAFNLSGAYSKTDTIEEGNNTTRWAQGVFNSVTINGVTTNCFAKTPSKSATATTYVYQSSTACDTAALAFHPRIPRYGNISHDRERQGYTASGEWQPTDHTHIEVDGLYSRYHEVRTEQWAEILFRSDEAGINVINPVYDTKGDLIAGSFSGSAVNSNTSQPATYFERHENYYQDQRDTFWQVNGKIEQQFGDKLKGILTLGASDDDQNTPIATTIALDNPTASGYSYDYTNMQSPVLKFGTDPTNPANFQLDEIRDRPTDIKNRFQTAKLDFTWDVAPGFDIKAGGLYRAFEFYYISGKRDTTACTTVGAAPVFGPGGFLCSSKSAGYPLSAFPQIGTDQITLGAAGQPGGTTTQYVVGDIASDAAFSGLYARPGDPSTDPTNNRSVTEHDKGAYLQFDVHGKVAGIGYAANAGVRYVETDTSSTALQAVQDATGKVTGYAPITVPGSYDNWLPALNLNIFPTNKTIVRFAVAKTLTRPSLPNLSPNASVDQFNFKVSFGNPRLLPATATNYDLAFEWYFAPQSLLSVGLFSKDVQNGTQSVTVTGPFASSGLPTSILTAGTPAYNAVTSGTGDSFSITTIQNAPTVSNIKGLELTGQAPFRFLPGFLRHFGVIGSLTLTQSSSTNTVSGPAPSIVKGVAGTATTSATAGGLAALPSVTVVTTYQGASKVLYSATGYYEDDRFGARVSYTYRGPYLDNTSGSNGDINDGFTAYKTVDASLRYSLFKNVDLTVDAVNLLDQYTFHYTDYAAERNYEYYHTGRTIVFGARVKL